MKRKLIYYVAWSSIIIAMSMMIYLSFLMFYPYKVVTFNNDKFSVLTPEVKRGDMVIFKSSFCRYTDVTSIVSRQLINDFIYYYQEFTSSLPKGCQVKVMNVKIPEYAEPGEYYIRNTYRYKINMIREIVYIKDTEKFRVVK